METKELLKLLLVSNVITAVVACGALYFSYQAMENADWASSYASDAASDISYIKRWGVECE